MAENEELKPDILAEEPRKPKQPLVGLILLLGGAIFVLIITALQIAVPSVIGELTYALSTGSNPELSNFMLNAGDYVAYGVVIAAVIILVLYAVKKTKSKVAPIAKYAGLIVLTFAFSVGLIGFLLGGFGGLGSLDTNVWYLFTLNPNWPGYSVLLAASLLAVPLCFSRRKTKIYGIITLVAVGIYIYLTSSASAMLRGYDFFDITWGIFISGLLAGFFYKAVLEIPEQEKLDTDSHVLGPMRDAYKKVLTVKAILEKKPVKVVQKIETEEGIKEEIKQEVPQGNPEELINQAIAQYSETEELAKDYGDRYSREVAKCGIWKKRLGHLLEEQKMVAAKKMPEAEYQKRWLYIF